MCTTSTYRSGTIIRYDTENSEILNEKGYPNKCFADNEAFGVYCLLQVYKIRKYWNNSLVIERLGKSHNFK